MIKIHVLIDKKLNIKAVYDSGSNVSLISKRVVDLLKSSLIKNKALFKTINGFNFSSARANITLTIGNVTNNLDTYIVKNNNFSYDLLLGLDAIKKFNLIQDENLNILQRVNEDEIIKIENRNEKDCIRLNMSEEGKGISNSETKVKLNISEGKTMKESRTNLNHIIDEDFIYRKTKVSELIEKYKHVFAKNKFEVGRVKTREAEIKLMRHEWVTSRAYKCSIPDEQEIKTQIKKLLEADLIEESDSPFASPVTLAFKKEDGRRTRLCIDFRKLNSLIIPECYPFPTINDVIDKVPNCKYFSVVDINSAFWSIPMKKEDQEKTSFITKFGKFMFKVLPFGLKNAPAIFQRILSNILRRRNLYFSRKLSEKEKKMKIIYLECKAIKDAIKYWQYYLIGREFIVCSDHKPLENLRTKSRTDEILGDLIHYLSQFNFKIIYKKGKENVLADLLSRQPVLEYFENEDAISTVNLIELKEIINDQNKNIEELILAQNTEKSHNIIFKKLKGRRRIFVSTHFGIEIIRRVHDHYGHIGVVQMREKIRPIYYFKNMDSLISQFYKNCTICLENKVRTSRPIGLMSKLGPAKEPYEILSIDSVGGFGGNRSPKKFMHILVDHFSRYAWISTSTGQCAQDFIKLIDPIAQKNKINIILADQYTA